MYTDTRTRRMRGRISTRQWHTSYPSFTTSAFNYFPTPPSRRSPSRNKYLKYSLHSYRYGTWELWLIKVGLLKLWPWTLTCNVFTCICLISKIGDLLAWPLFDLYIGGILLSTLEKRRPTICNYAKSFKSVHPLTWTFRPD